MLQVLDEALKALPALLSDPETPWVGLAVRYEKPYVDRLWVQWGEYRLNLHRIFPCDVPLYHPHPWPSAVEIFDGRYEMGLGADHPETALISTVVLGPGSRYEMANPRGWHYVKPLGGPSMSVMVTGKPWPNEGVSAPGKGLVHPNLSTHERAFILAYFKIKMLLGLGNAESAGRIAD